jgi:hypothetical protein
LKDKQDDVLDKDKTMNNVQKRNICNILEADVGGEVESIQKRRRMHKLPPKAQAKQQYMKQIRVIPCSTQQLTWTSIRFCKSEESAEFVINMKFFLLTSVNVEVIEL